jgi:hypothetical protein
MGSGEKCAGLLFTTESEAEETRWISDPYQGIAAERFV